MCAIIGFDSPTLTEQEIRPYFDRTISRGPDMSRMEKAGRGMLGFHRLAIMGLHEEGMQPFHLGGDMAVCNGELYGFRPLKKELEAKGYTFASESDCELILPLYREYGVEMFAKLDAEFAMIIYDAKADSSPRATPSASVRSSTAISPTAASSSPARRRTSSVCASASCPSRRVTTTPTANSSATPTSPR